MHTLDSEQDEILIREYQNGNNDALEKLFKKYYSLIFKVLCIKGLSREDAEDATQDICIKLLDFLAGFRFECPLWNAIMRIINNKVIDIWRSNESRRLFVRIFEGIEIIHLPPEIINHDYEKLKYVVAKCLKSLKNKNMRILVCMYLKGFKRKQMVELLGLKWGTVNGTLERGKILLRECVKNNFINNNLR